VEPRWEARTTGLNRCIMEDLLTLVNLTRKSRPTLMDCYHPLYLPINSQGLSCQNWAVGTSQRIIATLMTAAVPITWVRLLTSILSRCKSEWALITSNRNGLHRERRRSRPRLPSPQQGRTPPLSISCRSPSSRRGSRQLLTRITAGWFRLTLSCSTTEGTSVHRAVPQWSRTTEKYLNKQF
jgi:hypothetical protein